MSVIELGTAQAEIEGLFGIRMRAARNALRLSQREFAENFSEDHALQLDPSAVSRIETGQPHDRPAPIPNAAHRNPRADFLHSPPHPRSHPGSEEMTDLLDLIAEGESRRDEAFDRLDQSDKAAENRLLRAEILYLGRQHDVFSANDLPEWVREATSPNRRGRMFSQLAGEGVLSEVGMVKSSNPKAHGKRVLTYRLVAA